MNKTSKRAMSQHSDKHKLFFRLEQGEDGYPPADWESLWGTQHGEDTFIIDNIPFYACGISIGDLVKARDVQGELRFEEVVRYSGHGTVRIIIYDTSEVQTIREELDQLGCSSELSHVSGLIAIDIPPEATFDELHKFLENGEKLGRFDYEEAAVWW